MKQHLFWHDSSLHPRSLGCTQCVLKQHCDGLNVAADAFSCADFCCCKPENCSSICPSNPVDFVAHVAQVQGWSLDNVPRQPIRVVQPPVVVPLLYGDSGRHSRLPSEWIAVPLGQLYDKRSGQPRFTDREQFADAFKIRPDARILVSGTDEDAVIERWWEHPRRDCVLASMRSCGTELITTPNFSMFSTVPRPDHWYNAKRIALVWAEIVASGIVAALHLNACNDDGWNRWIDFVGERDEVAHVSFEFGTGARSPRRSPWHVEQLVRLARTVNRPLHLTVRGGTDSVKELASAFTGISFVDSTPYMRTVKRRIPMTAGSRQRWVPYRTDEGEDLSMLLLNAVDERTSYLQAMVRGDKSVGGIVHDTDIKNPGTADSCERYARDNEGLSPDILKT